MSRTRRRFAALITLGVAAGLLPMAAPARADHTPNPTWVTMAGSFQSELGCPGDWQPDCDATGLTYDADDEVWQGTFDLPAGSYEYKAALNHGWDENYGVGGVPGGANLPLVLAEAKSVKFFYSHHTHWVTDNVGSIIATAPGSYQSELGCPGDWQPDCLRSWLQDPDGDGTYSFSTTALPPDNYEFKVAINQTWDENYGAGGVPGGANVPFSVPAAGSRVTFSYNAVTHVPSVEVLPPSDPPNVEWDGVRHDSRDALYRTPQGAVPAGTPVTIRLRTFHNDVTEVKLRVYDLNAAGQRFETMVPAATDVSCYQAGLDARTCDFWSVTITNASPNNIWYRFVVTDRSDSDYYADNTTALDGGLGATTDDVVDTSYALMWYDPAFTAPAWAKDAVIYQIFPDRFRNGRSNNDAETGDIRYDDPVLALRWGTLPEGYCRNYADAATNCPWRFDDTPPDYSPTKETPRGRDYQGGDLRGIDQQLDYLRQMGVNTLYLNPVFDAASNHSYDTQDYYRIDPYFGTQKDWENLAKHAKELGIRIVLDGVFNHLSSDSPIFDRYHHYSTVGACESTTSPYRDWFYFRDVAAGTGECVSSTGTPNGATYTGWFGFDSIPVINKSLPAVQKYFLTNPDSVTKHWLRAGSNGWRLDVSGDPSFPAGYWETFRQVAKGTKADALLIGETWQKDSALLSSLRGDRMDTTMNYRLRDAVIGFLTPGPFDSKGFGDSGRILLPSEVGNRLASVREDYPDAAFYSLMNLLGSHDTERILWALTPGTETRADKELNTANVTAGKQSLRLASLLQYALPGAPTVFYGDEIGLTGDDDPDDRRAYPWSANVGRPDTALRAWYTSLAAARRSLPALRDGDLRVLLTDDAKGTIVLGRKTGSGAAVVVVNRTGAAQTVTIPVAGYLPNGTTVTRRLSATGNGPTSVTVTGGNLQVTVPAKGGLLFGAQGVDLTGPAAPVLRLVAEPSGAVDVAWNAVPGAVGYDVYASPLPGGGYVKQNISPVTGTSYTVTGLRNGVPVYVIVKALDSLGNESAPSNEVSGLPHYTIGWANLQWPPTLNHTISAVNRTGNVYGQVWIDGVTNLPGATPTLWAQLGFGPDGSNPAGNAAWTWVDASFNTNAGNNDEFMASLLPETVGTFDYVYRYSTTGGRDWLYADLNGPVPSGNLPPNPGALTVNASGDTTPPVAPTNLRVLSASPAGVELAWDPVAGDPSLYGYEVERKVSGGAWQAIARTTATTYTDPNVVEGTEYKYRVRSFDESFNWSAGYSNEVTAVAQLRTVTLNFNVTVPASTDATGRSVYIAGFLDRLDGGLPQWDPAGVVLTRADATHWTITLTGKEFTQIEYKYALGSWDYVEKGAACDEVANRTLTLTYGASGVQNVNDTVLNWRNVSPCGN